MDYKEKINAMKREWNMGGEKCCGMDLPFLSLYRAHLDIAHGIR